MAAGKRIRHAAWFPAATFDLRLFAETPIFDSRPKGRRQPSPRVCPFKKIEAVEGPQYSDRGVSLASGTTVGVTGHG